MKAKMKDIMKNINQSKKFEDLYNVIWRSCEKDKLERKHYQDISNQKVCANIFELSMLLFQFEVYNLWRLN